MNVGTAIRNMGAAANADCIRHCAQAAEAIDLAHLWTVDHIAIPPDDAEGSNGRWLDPLATLAFLAAATTRIDLGVSVLVLPYRPALPTAKWIATIQELSGGRLRLGIGPGWMAPEFRALGVDRSARGKITDEVVDFIRACFDAPDDTLTANGQAFLFRPNPPRPPIYVGGMTDAALARTIRCADGWLPMGIDPDKLRPRIERLTEMAADAGRERPDIILIGSLPESQTAAVEQLAACAALGATDYIQASRYDAESGFDAIIARLEDLRRQLG
jgi:probable F420-dependent oxidoreductase